MNHNRNSIDISVVITVYNIEKYIGECLDSILSQDGVSIEIICVDDCSIDNSRNIVESYMKDDGRIKLIHTSHNGGLATARNIGIRESRGKYLYNIDGDDKLEKGALKKMFFLMERYDLDLLSFSAYSFFENEEMKRYGDEFEYIRKHEYPGIQSGQELFAKLMRNGDRVNGNMVLYCFRTSFLKDYALYLPEGVRYCDDKMFSIYMSAKRVLCINDALYLRRYREGSVVTSPMKKNHLESMIILLVYELMTWKRIGSRDDVEEQIEKYFNDRIKEIYFFDELFQDDPTKMEFLEKHKMEKYFYEIFFKKKSVYNSMIRKDDLNRIIKADRIYVYGIGNISGKVVDILVSNGVYNFEFVVSELEDKKRLYGRTINEISSIEVVPGLFFIIAVSEKYKHEIEETLLSKGIRDYCFVSE